MPNQLAVVLVQILIQTGKDAARELSLFLADKAVTFSVLEKWIAQGELGPLKIKRNRISV